MSSEGASAASRSTVEVLIRQKKTEADGVVSLELVSPTGENLPPFEAGAHVDVHVAPGIIRQYSLCNDPAERHRYLLGILREEQSRGGSAGIHDAFAAGQTITISLPRNQFPLAEEGGRAILLAGGIGITPILAMAHRLAAAGADFELHYCVRSRSRAAFADTLAQAAFSGKAALHVDDGPQEQRFSLERDIPAPDERSHLYVCGPGGFLDAVREHARRIGWDDGRVHFEAFTNDVDVTGDSFTVRAAASGVTVEIGPDQTIANVLLENGVDIITSCEQGVCGVCLTPVLEGIPDHRDAYQTEEEKAANTHITICCSRSRTKVLVLDV